MAKKLSKNIDLLIIGFIFLVLFLLPILFVRIDGKISWIHVIKIWKDQVLIIPIFLINHFFLMPKFLDKKKYWQYFSILFGLIAIAVIVYFNYENYLLHKKLLREGINKISEKRPSPIPPYANLLMYSILIMGVDLGMFFSKKWQLISEQKIELERRNTMMELEILKNQVNPHFFMNTLNNIYALMDKDANKAKKAIIRLSKLMRYLLYENSDSKVPLSKEFDFLKSYTELMQLRFTDQIDYRFSVPENFEDYKIPPLLFISYIENAFKYGISYANPSKIYISFKIQDNKLIFNCINTVHKENHQKNGGLGLLNSKNRLDLLYGKNYQLKIDEENQVFGVLLKIPLL